MTDHPILFSGPMVNALLAGRKTQTRRMSKSWLKVKEGDRLWVRESWFHDDPHGVFYDEQKPLYRADGEIAFEKGDSWKPSIHMPRWASRLTLIATADARVERLQDISEEDARAEGTEPTTCANVLPPKDGFPSYRSAFAMLWQSLHTKPGERWDDNPELVVLTLSTISFSTPAIL
jgi:hypothetical protein